jgi:hypothetical protein
LPVSERDALIWYDGAMRDRREAVERIERDALSFLAQAGADFERDDTAWLRLLDDLTIPIGLDAEDYGTFARGYFITVTADHVVINLDPRLPRTLDATFAALVAKRWCFAPRLSEGSIEMQVRGLDRAIAVQIEEDICRQARAVSDGMQRSIAKLVAIAAPDLPPRVSSALDDAIRRVEAVRSAKIERLTSSESS